MRRYHKFCGTSPDRLNEQYAFDWKWPTCDSHYGLTYSDNYTTWYQVRYASARVHSNAAGVVLVVCLTQNTWVVLAAPHKHTPHTTLRTVSCVCVFPQWVWQASYAPHGPIHGWIGGVGGDECESNMRTLEEHLSGENIGMCMCV